MTQDIITFFQSLLNDPMGAESILPESMKDLIPVDSISSMTAQLSDTAKLTGTVITLVLALLACFLGYKLARVFMTITGFGAGLMIGWLIATQVLKVNGWLITLCTIAGGVLFALFSYWIYVVGIFVLCFMLAFVAAAALLPFSGDLQFFLSTLIGFLVGALAIKFIRPVIIFSSAIVGGSIASGLIASICQHMNVYTFSKFTAGGMTLIICILGIIVQLLTTSDADEEKRKMKKALKKEQRKAKRREKAAARAQ